MGIPEEFDRTIRPEERLFEDEAARNLRAAVATLAGTEAIEWRTWLDAMKIVCHWASVCRSAAFYGYHPRKAAVLERLLEMQPSHEVVSAHCGGHPDAHAWGRQVRPSIPATHLAVLARLKPGKHGGIVDV